MSGPLNRWKLTLSWPLDTIGPSLPNLVATVAGNLYELKQVSGLKLTDLRLPRAFAEAYPGPAFGVAGTRQIAGVPEGPMIGTIIKPSVGLSPDETAGMVADLCAGDIDFIKDDELQADGPACPFDDRLHAVGKVLNDHADRTGRKPLYAINLTGEIDEMRRRHDAVLAAGGNCIMVSLNSVGLAGLTALRRHSQLPIHAHRNGWGALGRSEDNGWSYPAWAKLWRIAGVDHMHVNGLANKFWESDDCVIASARSMAVPLWGDAPMTVLPVFSSGQTVYQAHETLKRLGNTDLIHCAGGGIVAHPNGIAAGVGALRAAWSAAMAGIPLDLAAAGDTDLRVACVTYA